LENQAAPPRIPRRGGVLFTVRDIELPLKWIKIFISKGKDFQLFAMFLVLICDGPKLGTSQTEPRR